MGLYCCGKTGVKFLSCSDGADKVDSEIEE